MVVVGVLNLTCDEDTFLSACSASLLDEHKEVCRQVDTTYTDTVICVMLITDEGVLAQMIR